MSLIKELCLYWITFQGLVFGTEYLSPLSKDDRSYLSNLFLSLMASDKNQR